MYYMWIYTINIIKWNKYLKFKQTNIIIKWKKNAMGIQYKPAVG